MIMNSTFENISSAIGGAFFTHSSDAVLRGNNFKNNSAREKGGALYLSCKRDNGKGK
jgi:hypothetical protein